MKYDLVIKNGLIYDLLNNCFIKKDIGIIKNKIIKLDSSINNGVEIVDVKGCIILPGFINSHIHFGEYYVKGYSGKKNTFDYIKYAEHINSINNKYSEEMRKTSSIICAYNACEYGQTTLVGIRGWDCLEKYNIRLYMGYPLMNSPKLSWYLNEPFKNFEQRNNTDLNNYYFFVHSLLTVDEKLLKLLSKYIKNKNIKIAIHLSETKKENNIILAKYGMTPTQVLKKYNLLGKNTLLVHCCYLNGKDIEIIKESGCTISLNPLSNIRLGNKVPIVRKLDGINLCIGTDGIASSDSLNILRSCHILGLKNNIQDVDLIKMITINPAKFLNQKLGLIEEDFLADLLIYDLNDKNIIRKETFVHDLIYSNDIKPKHVIINGNFVFRNFENIFISKAKLKSLNISDKLSF